VKSLVDILDKEGWVLMARVWRFHALYTSLHGKAKKLLKLLLVKTTNS